MGLRGGAFHPISDRGRLCCWPGAALTAMHRSGRGKEMIKSAPPATPT
jgi:hypothetical protein